MTFARLSLIIVASLLLTAAACGGGNGDSAGATTPAGTAGTTGTNEPAAGTSASGGGDGNSLVWTVPETWIEEEPSSAMRKAQYRVPGEDGDAELTVFYFGPGQGGDPMANARRWAGQFEQPDGRPSHEVMRTSRMEVERVRVLMVEVSGTYSGGDMPGAETAEKQDGWAMLGAIAEGPDANWFFKMTGPETTIQENRRDFRDLLRSLEAGA